jgi:beta-glucanase (GH16 family)
MSNPIARLLGLSALAMIITACGGGGGADSPKVKEAFFPEPTEEWQLEWSDEFDGASLDLSNWDIQEGDGSDVGLDRWGNNEQQWYTPNNITVADGTMTITARAEELVEGFPYTSARIRTFEKFDFTYGRVEASIKAAPGQGLWSAFWMLPTDSPYDDKTTEVVDWAATGELDIMEVVNADTDNEQAYHGLYHGFPWPLHQQSVDDMEVDDPAGDFHVYAVEWDETKIRWYVDGKHVKTVGADHYYSYYYAGRETGYQAGTAAAPFDTDFHVLLNLAVGGWLPGEVDNGDIPADMVVDYVRVYSCSYDTANGVGCNSNADRNNEETPDAQNPFEDSWALYTDAPGSLEWSVGGEEVVRDLALGIGWDNGGAITLMELPADDASRGTVIDVSTSNAGNIVIYAADNARNALFGMGNSAASWELHAGELKFDIYIDSAATDPDSSIFIKMDSGWPALGFYELKVADLPADQWTTVSVKVNDLLANSGEQPLDMRNVLNLFVLEPTSSAHVQLDNIELACGHPVRNGCGILPPGGESDGEIVNVFIDEVDPVWTNGIGAWDDQYGQDYFNGATGNHITWNIVGSGDPEHGDIISVNFGTNGANGVFYIQSAEGVDMSAFADAGKLIFDLRLEEATTHGITYKVDCFFPCTSGDKQLDLSDHVRGEWNTVEVSVADLIATGLDITRVNTGLVIFPTWGDQQGVSFELDNIRWENPGGEGPGGGGESPDATIYVDGLNSEWILWDCCGQATVGEVEASDTARGMVAEIAYGGTGETVAGFTFGDAAGSQSADLSAYEGGTLEFDALVLSAPASGTDNWLLKVESENASIFVEIPLSASEEGVAPVVGEWQHYTFPLDTTLGAIDLATVQVALIFPPWAQSAGGIIQLDNVGFVLEGGSGVGGGGGGGDSVTVFADQLEDAWELWDCCGGADVSVQDAGGAYGAISELSFVGAGGTVSGFLYGGDPDAPDSIDVSAYTKLEFDAKVVTAPNTGDDTWLMKVESANAAQFVEVNLNTSEEGQSPVTGEWQHYTFYLEDLGSVDWSDLQIIMIFPPWGTAQGGLIQIDNVEFTN